MSISSTIILYFSFRRCLCSSIFICTVFCVVEWNLFMEVPVFWLTILVTPWLSSKTLRTCMCHHLSFGFFFYSSFCDLNKAYIMLQYITSWTSCIEVLRLHWHLLCICLCVQLKCLPHKTLDTLMLHSISNFKTIQRYQKRTNKKSGVRSRQDHGQQNE